MDQAKLADRLGRANGIAARVLGAPHDLYRPGSAMNPLDLANRVLRLPAAFPPDLKFAKPAGYGTSLVMGVFDSSATQPGDYLAGPSGTYFIASQRPLLPVLCVLANRTVSFGRPAAPASVGANAYGGVSVASASLLAANWPASVLSNSAGQQGLLPSDATIPTWVILLPTMPVSLRSADLVMDDLGRNFVVASAEQSALGWRITANQAAT
jgi:hypothetical protein